MVRIFDLSQHHHHGENGPIMVMQHYSQLELQMSFMRTIISAATFQEEF